MASRRGESGDQGNSTSDLNPDRHLAEIAELRERIDRIRRDVIRLDAHVIRLLAAMDTPAEDAQ